MKHIKFVVVLFTVAIISLVFVQFTSIQTNISYTADIENSNFRSKKIGEAYLILNLLLDVETGSRGYILTGIPTFLDPYNHANKQLPHELESFYIYLSQQEKAKISSLVKARVESASHLIKKKWDKIPITSIELENGKKIMDDLRSIIHGIVDKEESHLDQKSIAVQDSFKRSIIQLVGGSIFSFILVALSAYFVYAEFRKRSKAEKNLQVSLATSEAISREIDFGIIACDMKGNIIFANKWVLAKTYRQISVVEDFFASNSLVAIPLKKMFQGEIGKIDQIDLQFKNEKLVLAVSAAPFQINQEEKGLLLSIVDTTEATKQMASMASSKKEAEVASSNKSDFLAKMSHEIRTPLNAILGVGDILALTSLNEEQERCIGIFQRSAQTLNNLVNDILDLSKIEAGKIDIINKPFSLKNLVLSCTSIMDFRASQKGLLFTTDVSSDVDHFIGDENRIRQIILNILGNAIKFTEEGEINFQVKCINLPDNKKELRFIIRDSGRGISEKNIGKLFSNYQQEHSRISSEYGGTGLGLSLSRELARLMGGDIDLKSELGKGSEFTFYASFEVATGSFVEEKIDLDVNFKKIKLLLVDDNEENRFIVKRYLNDFEMDIQEAVDGDDAIESFKREKFDLILMDINMPKKDGLTATKIIRDLEKENNLERTCIIALSANALSQEYIKAQNAGCDDYLTKPIARMKLITTMKKWVGKSNQAEEEFVIDDSEIDIDEELLALVPSYLANRKKDVVLLREALVKKDISLIGKISHNIKGTALSYGQVDLDKIAHALNSASKNINWKEMESAVNEMELLLGVKNGN